MTPRAGLMRLGIFVAWTVLVFLSPPLVMLGWAAASSSTWASLAGAIAYLALNVGFGYATLSVGGASAIEASPEPEQPPQLLRENRS